jgi:hypothetical protein
VFRGVSGVVLCAALLWALTGCTNGQVPRLGILERDQSSDDKLPAAFAEIPPEVEQNSTRYLGATGAGSYWVGVNTEGLVCLLALTEMGPMSSCTDANSLPAQISIPALKETAQLVEDGAPIDAPTWREVSPNLRVARV